MSNRLVGKMYFDYIFTVDTKSETSARSMENPQSTPAVETEEQLLGVGHLPKGKIWSDKT